MAQPCGHPDITPLPPIRSPAVLDPPVGRPVQVLRLPVAEDGDGVRVGGVRLLEEDIAVLRHQLCTIDAVLRNRSILNEEPVVTPTEASD